MGDNNQSRLLNVVISKSVRQTNNTSHINTNEMQLF